MLNEPTSDFSSRCKLALPTKIHEISEETGTKKIDWNSSLGKTEGKDHPLSHFSFPFNANLICLSPETKRSEGKETLPSIRMLLPLVIAVVVVIMILPIISQHRIYVSVSQDRINDVSVQTVNVPLISILFPSPSNQGTGVYTIKVQVQPSGYNVSLINVPTGQYTFLASNITQGVVQTITVSLMRNNGTVDTFTISSIF